MRESSLWLKPSTGEFRVAYTNPGAGWVPAKAVTLDAIVIDRADLPEVALDADGDPAAREFYIEATEADIAAAYADARALIALAEYRKAHPPVDQAQVDALADLISTHLLSDRTAMARRLIATGQVRVEVAS